MPSNGPLYGRVNQNQRFSGDYETYNSFDYKKRCGTKNAPAFSFGSSARFATTKRDRTRPPKFVGAGSSMGKQVRSNHTSYAGAQFATSSRFPVDKPRKEKLLNTGSMMGKQTLSQHPSSRAVRFYEGGTRLYPLLKDGDARVSTKPPLSELMAREGEGGAGDSGLAYSSIGKQVNSTKPRSGTMVFGREEKMPWIKPKDNPGCGVDIAASMRNLSTFKSEGFALMGSQPKDKMPRAVNKPNGVPGPGSYAPVPLSTGKNYDMGPVPDKSKEVTNACASRPYAHCAF